MLHTHDGCMHAHGPLCQYCCSVKTALAVAAATYAGIMVALAMILRRGVSPMELGCIASVVAAARAVVVGCLLSAISHSISYSTDLQWQDCGGLRCSSSGCRIMAATPTIHGRGLVGIVRQHNAAPPLVTAVCKEESERLLACFSPMEAGLQQQRLSCPVCSSDASPQSAQS